MRNEAELCTIIKNSLISGVKIPDPSGNYTQTSIRPFDGIGLLDTEAGPTFVCWEAKWLKEPKAFNFNKIEPHQAFYLSEYSKAANVTSLLIIGVDFSLRDKRAFVIKWSPLMKHLYDQGFSVHKDILFKLPFNVIEKGKFTFTKYIDDLVVANYFAEKYPELFK